VAIEWKSGTNVGPVAVSKRTAVKIVVKGPLPYNRAGLQEQRLGK
jgi:hypothetical protein